MLKIRMLEKIYHSRVEAFIAIGKCHVIVYLVWIYSKHPSRNRKCIQASSTATKSTKFSCHLYQMYMGNKQETTCVGLPISSNS